MLIKNRILLLVTLSYLVLGFGYMTVTPVWQNPDEPAHYNYIRYLVENRDLPILQLDDYNQVYLEEVIRKGFPAGIDISPLRYEFHQPPLYYLLATPFYTLGDGNVLPLRILSLLLGVVLLVITFNIGVNLAPHKPHISSCMVILMALIPQHVAMMASINNDALAETLMAMVLLFVIRERTQLSRGVGERTLFGICIGLCLLTKLTVAIAYPVAAYALFGRINEDRRKMLSAYRSKPKWIHSWQDLFLILILPLLIALPLWLRNLNVYGWPDAFALLQPAAAVALQPNTADWISTHGFWDWLYRMILFTFQSFWGQFGWMAVPMQPFVYSIIATICMLMAVLWCYDHIWGMATGSKQLDHRIRNIFLLSFLLTVIMYLLYNIKYVQHQGRYLYSALVPLCVAMGCAWSQMFVRDGFDLRRYAPGLLYIFMILLNLHALLKVLMLHPWQQIF